MVFSAFVVCIYVFAGGCSSDFNLFDYVEVKLPPLSEEHRAFFILSLGILWKPLKTKKVWSSN